MSPATLPEPAFAAFVALDWADRQHHFALEEAASRRRSSGVIEHTPQQVQAWVSELLQRFGGQPIAVCLEQSRGPLLAMLSQYESLVLYPVNPVMAKRLRQAFYPSGAKDDAPDAVLLLDLLVRHRERLRRLDPDTAEMRSLQLLVEQRRKLVDEKTRQKNRLTAQLKLYYPQVLEWFDGLDTVLALDFLERWPTLEAAQRARPSTLLRFFEQHGARRAERNQKRVEAIRAARAATRDRAILAVAPVVVRMLAGLIRCLLVGIADIEERIEELGGQFEDYELFRPLPGAGQALAPRLLAAFGTQRERFGKAEELENYSGIAPVVERSGKRSWTRVRWACPKFLRQTFHEFAAFSVQYSAWARVYYEQQRDKGKSHHTAVRALAFKWIRILWRCWQDRTPYDEARYLAALARRGSPLAAKLGLAPSSAPNDDLAVDVA